MNTRSRGTSSEYVLDDPYFYFSDLSLREKKTSERLASCFIKRNHASDYLVLATKVGPKKRSESKKKIEESPLMKPFKNWFGRVCRRRGLGVGC